jgi:hypothetical protein
MNEETQANAASDIFKLLSSCSSALGLHGLARVAASSKHLRDACIAIARRDARSLLSHALDQTFDDETEQEWQLQAVLWLWQVAPFEAAEAAATDVAEQLVRMPAGRLHWAVRLVAAGVFITHKHLLAAARSMVPGVEVWVQAQQHLELYTDIPAAAVAVCCGDIAGIMAWVSCNTLWDVVFCVGFTHHTTSMYCWLLTPGQSQQHM